MQKGAASCQNLQPPYTNLKVIQEQQTQQHYSIVGPAPLAKSTTFTIRNLDSNPFVLFTLQFVAQFGHSFHDGFRVPTGNLSRNVVPSAGGLVPEGTISKPRPKQLFSRTMLAAFQSPASPI